MLSKRLLQHFLLATAAWSGVVVASYLWDRTHIRENTLQTAKAEANAYFNKDLAFRLWASSHGGVYVESDERTPPSPYLAHIPDRDVITTTGKTLTLMNPAYIMRQLMEDYAELYGIKCHITSLNPLRPENAPNEWEALALAKFRDKGDEFFEIASIEGKEFLRLMRPMLTTKECLKCHAIQGYKVGDIRGGVSVSVPLENLRRLESIQHSSHLHAHLSVWLLGLMGIAFSMHRIRTHAQKERTATNAMQAKENFNKLLLNSTAEAIYGLDTTGACVFCNTSFLKIMGYGDEKEMLGKDMHSLVHYAHPDGTPYSDENCPIYRAFRTGQGTHMQEEYLWRRDGTGLPVEIWSYPVMEGNTVIGAVVTFFDITRRKEDERKILSSLREKETLLQEIHHRVKNNMAIISSMLTLQAEHTGDHKTLHSLMNCKSRIHSMALVHEKLYQNSDLSDINVADYVSGLTENLSRVYRVDPAQIEIKARAGDFRLNLDTLVPCGLILNELLTNAIRHAFPGGRKGTVEVELSTTSEQSYKLIVSDDGCGIPEGLDIMKPQSLGLRLVGLLVSQLEGNMVIDKTGGTSFEIDFNSISTFKRRENGQD